MKMTERNWLLKECQQLADDSHSYAEKAFFEALETVIAEQIKRIQQAEGELDGSLWSPRKW